jgi:hypothetical protein
VKAEQADQLTIDDWEDQKAAMNDLGDSNDYEQWGTQKGAGMSMAQMASLQSCADQGELNAVKDPETALHNAECWPRWLSG